MSNTYTNCLPAWSVGVDAYKEVYNVVRRYGKNAVVVGGKTALSKGYDKLKAALEGTGFTVSDPIWYGGNSTFENGDALIAMEEVQKADMVFAMGGGRAIDTCKYVAEKLDKPLFTFPTIASNCAPVTAIGVFYKQDHTFAGYFYPSRCPQHCFIDTQIIAESPEQLLWAGIGDGLSKECESEFCTRGRDLPHTPYMGRVMGGTCTEPFLRFGQAALDQIRAKKVGYELEQVALCIIISTGLVSNFTTTESDYYYNSSMAHAFYNASTLSPKCAKHLHGEVVSLGVLVLLTYIKDFAMRDQFMKFNASIGLPITLADVELTEDYLDAMADKAATTVEWTSSLTTFTKEAFKQAILDADAAGKAFYAAQAK